MNTKIQSLKTQVGSLRIQLDRVRSENIDLKKKIDKLEKENEELRTMKAMDDVSIKELLDKYHQIIEVEANRNRACKAFNALATGGYIL